MVLYRFDAKDSEKKYAVLRRTVEKAGFFVTKVHPMGGWDRVSIASKKFDNGGYHGNSFWATCLRGDWYLGTWGGFVYRIQDNNTVAECCVSWLKRAPSGTRSDFDEIIKTQYGLLRVQEEEFDLCSLVESGLKQ